ncbi:PEP-CTERM sorting domain-containing protein [Massilia sp. ST3]|uniref:PEP-CTERM sorting domain-containing protein n=1 Tax=Massilia sp. ST3 TaxID=2824903 RepID=UPI001B839AFC|nr:PEP-CTERM sorting domain-containing protein [Massilia sp. ST3]MBQ5946413.1 PEP-CTERM sorting domain-containing protein [Massilia sp. ST3]
MKFAARTILTAIAGISAALISTSASAGYIGKQVSLNFTAGNASADLVFAGPQTVGSGVEFTGQSTDVFGQVWTLSVDVFDTGVILKTDSGTFGNISSFPDRFLFDLSFMGAPVSTMALADLTVHPYFSNPLTSITSTGPDSIRFGFQGMYTASSYTFENVQTNQVPEPGSIALLGLGLAGLGALRRRRG